MSGYIKGGALIAAALLGCLGLAVSVEGASFDCAKASTKVEHLICDNPDISKQDEVLAQSYKAAMQNQSKAEEIKQAQKLWVKERNTCAAADCVMRAYENRMRAISSSAGVAAENPKQLFMVTEGKGYSVCDNYARFLNSLPESEPLPLCHLKRAPDFPDLKDPDWEEMVIPSNLELVYSIEKIHAVSYHHRPIDTFEHWKAVYLQQIRDGEITPRLRRTHLVLVDNAPIETILAYEQDRDECDKEVEKNGYAYRGARTRLFVWNEQEQKIEEYTSWIAFSSDFELMLYQGKPLLFFPYWGGGTYRRLTGGIDVYHLITGGAPYGHLRRCLISFELTPNHIERMTQ